MRTLCTRAKIVFFILFSKIFTLFCSMQTKSGQFGADFALYFFPADAFSVFSRRDTIVIGPTPPGTGVM